MDQIKLNQEIVKLREEIVEKGTKYVDWVREWIKRYEEGLKDIGHMQSYEGMLSCCEYMLKAVPSGAEWHTKGFGGDELYKIIYECVKQKEKSNAKDH